MKKGVMNSKNGFTLIEALITMMILAVVSTIAFVTYRNYTTETVVVEAVSLAEDATSIVDIALQTNQPVPKNLLNDAISDNSASLIWVESSNDPAKPGYILSEMQFPMFGKLKVLALEKMSNGTWQCVSANKYFPQDEVIDEQLLPDFCRGSTSASTPSAGVAQSTTPVACPPQDSPDHTEKHNVGGYDVCMKPCPNGTSRDPRDLSLCLPDEVAGRVVEPDPAIVTTESVTVPVDKPQLEKCPAGFESVDPNSQKTGYSLRSKTENGATSYYLSKHKPQSCHLCRGPKFICERSHTVQECKNGTPGNPVVGCINDVENLIDGSRYVTRRCATASELKQEWSSDSATRRDCSAYDVHDLRDKHFSCAFGCIGDDCNLETVPKVLAKDAEVDALAKISPMQLSSGDFCVEVR